MVSAGDFKNGLTIEIEGNIFQILEFQHVKPGKGAAFVRTKLKNIISGGVVEKTFTHSSLQEGLLLTILPWIDKTASNIPSFLLPCRFLLHQ